MATAHTFENLLAENDVARITGLSVASVRRWRLLKQGPRYLKLGAAVRYKPEELSAWLESRPTGGEIISERGLPSTVKTDEFAEVSAS